MGQKQDELLKRIQKLVKQNQGLFDKNEKLQKAVAELSEQNERMKLRLKASKIALQEGTISEVEDRVQKYKMATVLFAYIGGFKHLTDADESEVVITASEAMRAADMPEMQIASFFADLRAILFCKKP